MDSPSSPPSSSVGRGTMAMLGKRTGVLVDARKAKAYSSSQHDENDENKQKDDEDMIDHYLSTAAARPVTQEHPASRNETEPSSILKKKNKSSYRRFQFSIPVGDNDDQSGVNQVVGDPGKAKAAKYMGRVVSKKGKVGFSPGDVSRASTALTTPRSRSDPSSTPRMMTQRSKAHDTPIHETPAQREIVETPQRDQDGGESGDDGDDMQASRISPGERSGLAQDRARKSPAVQPFIMTEELINNDDDDDNDDENNDLIPPPPPDNRDVVEQPPDAASPRAESEEAGFTDDNCDFEDDDDDDDKEGSGFQAAGTPAAPSERDEEEHERSLEKKRRLKTSRFVSPQGIQAGDRVFDEIPVDAYKHSPDDKQLRRSSRVRCPPLAYWKSERIIYGPNDDPEVMGLMPVPVSILQAQPTPYKKIKRPAKRPRYERDEESESEEDVPTFDSTKLRKKYKYLDGEIAFVWDDDIDDGRDLKVVTYFDSRLLSDLPLGPRKKSESKAVGQVGHGFDS